MAYRWKVGCAGLVSMSTTTTASSVRNRQSHHSTSTDSKPSSKEKKVQFFLLGLKKDLQGSSGCEIRSLCQMNLCIVGNILLLAPGVLLAKFGDAFIPTRDLFIGSSALLVLVIVLHYLLYGKLDQNDYSTGRRALCISATMLCSAVAAAGIAIHFGAFHEPASTFRVILAYAIANAALQFSCRILRVKTSFTEFCPVNFSF